MHPLMSKSKGNTLNPSNSRITSPITMKFGEVIWQAIGFFYIDGGWHGDNPWTLRKP